MEPRFFKRGNDLAERPERRSQNRFNGTTLFQAWKFKMEKTVKVGNDMLQWNHAFSSVEIRRANGNAGDQGGASMEPRFFKRGNPELVSPPAVRSRRFNGTTLFQAWKFHTDPGHGWMETTLQWNHAFSSVEITRLRRNAYRRERASMEPRFFKRGNKSDIANNKIITMLQWNHAFSSVEMATPVFTATSVFTALQWNHAFSSVEMAHL